MPDISELLLQSEYSLLELFEIIPKFHDTGVPYHLIHFIFDVLVQQFDSLVDVALELIQFLLNNLNASLVASVPLSIFMLLVFPQNGRSLMTIRLQFHRIDCLYANGVAALVCRFLYLFVLDLYFLYLDEDRLS